jgi:hypothetical protein
MQNLRVTITVAAMIIAVFSLAAIGEEKECTYGVDISCIEAFHTAMAPSCHKYMPAKDYATVRQHVPNMLAAAEHIAEFKLDSTYASVSDEFDKKRQAFLTAMVNLKKSADGTDDAKLAEVFDKMHMAFAEMASVLALAPDEVNEFHTIIAQVWHEYLPNKDYDAIKKVIPELKDGCTKMKAAKLHEAKQSVSKEYQAAIETVEKSIVMIEKAIESASDEKISEAVTALHDGYRGVRVLF